MGWVLGYAVEGLAFILTAAIGLRSAFVLYPVVVCALAGGDSSCAGRDRQGPDAKSAVPPVLPWVIAGVCVTACAYLAVGFFPITPLPGTESANYFQDYPWVLSLAAEAKHHWPIEDPNVAGEPFPYHWLAYVHWAAASQVTDLPLPTIFFRFSLFPVIIAVVLQAVVAGRVLARSAYVGLVALCLFMFVGELQLDTVWGDGTNVPFLGIFFALLLSSPSFLYGLPFFLALTTLIGQRISAPGERWKVGDWLVFALIALGACLTKVSILPLLLLALAVYAAWTWATTRKIEATPIAAGLVLAAVGAIVYLAMYRGHSSGVTLDLGAGFQFFRGMPAIELIVEHLRDVTAAFPGRSALFEVGGFALGIAGLLAAQLVGLAWILRRGIRRLDSGQRWWLAILVAGLANLFFLEATGTPNVLYGFFYGVVAGCFVAAQGLSAAWRERPSTPEPAVAIGAAVAAAALALAALYVLPLQIEEGDPQGVSALGVGLGEAERYIVWYAGIPILLTLVYLLARGVFGLLRRTAALLVMAVVLVIGLLDTPVDTLEAEPSFPPGGGGSGAAGDSGDLPDTGVGPR